MLFDLVGFETPYASLDRAGRAVVILVRPCSPCHCVNCNDRTLVLETHGYPGGLWWWLTKKSIKASWGWHFLMFVYKNASLLWKPFLFTWNPCNNFFLEENTKHITFSQDQWCQTHTWKCLYSRSGSGWLPVIFELVGREKCCCFSWIVVEHDWKCWNWCKGLTYDPWLLETAADQWTDLSLSPKRVDRLPWNVPVGLGGVYL